MSTPRTLQVTDEQAVLIHSLLLNHALSYSVDEDLPPGLEELNDKFEALVMMAD